MLGDEDKTTSCGVGWEEGRMSSRVWPHREVTMPERTQDKVARNTRRHVWAQLIYKSYVHISLVSVKTTQDKNAITNLIACLLLLALP